MSETMVEVIQFVRENDVKFIRLAFCDIFGIQKNISIMPNELERAFETGISFDSSAVTGFMNVEESDLFLIPDPTTLSVLPWRPAQGRVVRFFCDIQRADGCAFEGDGRNILKRTVDRAWRMGFRCKVGSECEFYLFNLDDRGNPTNTPYDRAGYCDIGPFDKGENIRREICLTLEEMGILPESSHHEQGPGQNEVDFKYDDALAAADNLITFKSVVKAIAARNGVHASFMPKPFSYKSGSGLHVNISLSKEGENIFRSGKEAQTPEAQSFIAGVMDRIQEITLFLNPLTNSYKRFGSFEAPKYITWSAQNISQLIRIPIAQGKYSRMELRSPDPSCNPYLAFSLLIQAGLEGIEKGSKICSPSDLNLYTAKEEQLSGIKRVPENLNAAIEAAAQSEFVRSVLPEKMLATYIEVKRREWKQYCQTEDKDKLEQELYFDII